MYVYKSYKSTYWAAFYDGHKFHSLFTSDRQCGLQQKQKAELGSHSREQKGLMVFFVSLAFSF